MGFLCTGLAVACGQGDGSLLDPSGAGTGGDGTAASGTGAAHGGTGGDLGLAVGGQGQGGGIPSGNGFCGSDLTGTLRDFTTAHPDFEYAIAVDPGLVAPTLGADGRPTYAGGPGGTITTHGPGYFAEWFHDVPGVNVAVPFTLTLAEGAGDVRTYDNSAFFPLDGQGFGAEGNAHNYHFTFELHTKFLYQGGEIFRFTGDDDLFTFIHGRLAIDLGGVHGAMSSEVDLDASAAALGLTPGEIYTLDVFFAERHTTESNFRIDTTLAFVDCGGGEVH
ncbi:MAG: fibro-slime domain-containing protein [Myxococcales bacterium]|nr:fibro-slime domain-containing protein [Myxococcales bacterium]